MFVSLINSSIQVLVKQKTTPCLLMHVHVLRMRGYMEFHETTQKLTFAHRILNNHYPRVPRAVQVRIRVSLEQKHLAMRNERQYKAQETYSVCICVFSSP